MAKRPRPSTQEDAERESNPYAMLQENLETLMSFVHTIHDHCEINAKELTHLDQLRLYRKLVSFVLSQEEWMDTDDFSATVEFQEMKDIVEQIDQGDSAD